MFVICIRVYICICPFAFVLLVSILVDYSVCYEFGKYLTPDFLFPLIQYIDLYSIFVGVCMYVYKHFDSWFVP